MESENEVIHATNTTRSLENLPAVSLIGGPLEAVSFICHESWVLRAKRASNPAERSGHRELVIRPGENNKISTLNGVTLIVIVIRVIKGQWFLKFPTEFLAKSNCNSPAE